MSKKKRTPPKFANCSPTDLRRLLKKLGGFSISEGAKHTLVEHNETKKRSTIPRHTKLKRFLVKDFIEDYLIDDLGYDPDDVYSNIRC